jgi:hypothetical protein
MCTLLYPLHLPSLSHYCSPFNRTYFTFLSFIICVYSLFKGFAMVFYLWIYCTLISLIPTITLPYHIHLILYYSKAFSSFFMPSSFTDAMYVNIIHSLLLSFHLSPPPSHSNSPTIGIFMFVSVYMFIFWVHLPHMRENLKIANIFFLNMAYFA